MDPGRDLAGARLRLAAAVPYAAQGATDAPLVASIQQPQWL
jgi:hypothetical protein